MSQVPSQRRSFLLVSVRPHRPFAFQKSALAVRRTKAIGAGERSRNNLRQVMFEVSAVLATALGAAFCVNLALALLHVG